MTWRARGRYPGAQKTAYGPWRDTCEQAQQDAAELRACGCANAKVEERA